jgi:hypothetical protein
MGNFILRLRGEVLRRLNAVKYSQAISGVRLSVIEDGGSDNLPNVGN